MSQITQRITDLRTVLKNRQLDAFLVTGTDPHAGEYLPPRWETRAFISGFTGSYGQVAVTLYKAALWTDSRYFIQARQQLQNSKITMYKLRVPDAVEPEEWLAENLKPGSRVGFDPQVITLSGYRKLAGALKKAGIEPVETADPFQSIWKNRPPLSSEPVFELTTEITGLSRPEKLVLIEQELKRYEADYLIISALDELAWMLNLRGKDIPYNPVFTGYAIFGIHETILFTNLNKLDHTLTEKLHQEQITLKNYEEFFPFLQTIRVKKIILDPATASFAIDRALRQGNEIIEESSPVAAIKCMKNDVELEGFRQVMKQDGVAVTQFLHWLHHSIAQEKITEYTAGRKLAEFRALRKGYQGESFEPIVGYRDHGAIVHLSVDPDNARQLFPDGILLFDTGGHYLWGTTDLTRTVALGPVTKAQKRDFTLVLKGMITLTTARFPVGTRGCNLDILARKALWDQGLNYGHGTGHGVGHFLNVHEGPAGIRQEITPVPIQPRMVLSNEPGIYREGKYGIRIENLILCVERESTPFGKFLGFETLTLCPIDRTLIDKSLLTRDEKQWLNNYHQDVRETLTPLLEPDVANFLRQLTEPV